MESVTPGGDGGPEDGPVDQLHQGDDGEAQAEAEQAAQGGEELYRAHPDPPLQLWGSYTHHHQSHHKPHHNPNSPLKYSPNQCHQFHTQSNSPLHHYDTHHQPTRDRRLAEVDVDEGNVLLPGIIGVRLGARGQLQQGVEVPAPPPGQGRDVGRGGVGGPPVHLFHLGQPDLGQGAPLQGAQGVQVEVPSVTPPEGGGGDGVLVGGVLAVWEAVRAVMGRQGRHEG